jgi:hypothetical protein
MTSEPHPELTAAWQRLAESIDGERRHWARVEVRPSDLAIIIATLDAARAQAVKRALAAAPVDRDGLDWPTLANIIREVDGNHDLGAGELAQRILDHPRFAAPVDRDGLQYTPGGLRYPTLDELNGGPVRTDLPMLRPAAAPVDRDGLREEGQEPCRHPFDRLYRRDYRVVCDECGASDPRLDAPIEVRAALSAPEPKDRPTEDHATCFAAPWTCPDPPAHCACGNVGEHVPNVDCDCEDSR